MSDIAALTPGRVAAITGAASGIGLAAALTLAARGLHVVLADLPGAALEAARTQVAAVAQGGAAVVALPTDVAEIAALEALRDRAKALGSVAIVMNNAAISPVGQPWDAYADWQRLIGVNLWGVINGVQAFAPLLLEQGEPALIVNTGSKQGITTPPGNAAYNVSKSAVKTFTEQTAHALRNVPGSQVTAHLLVPGFTFTGLTNATEKPAAAWTAQQVVDFMLDSLARDDFYILCPDNDVQRPTDEKRMAWAMGDVIENRPALSRWHPDHKAAFERFMDEGAAPLPGIM
ncbi:SDR family NAD(P)-dependent oxidoreductase [Lichenihabitans sp. Uapishka_5]|uniref:SDR family NAD(P)-dependent oxidoreductase n=1 Tax=Lichenihabitans sp. Uapishka_5 TaxID=3037302 RepID=UPI0029E81511|nr:SDR family NAD(P)-dependent oxidoreductase [Lichenihabitans sp. Uapishka_5]MDX7950948.1 SDR family NAD(P)-dependent oxidoreductase [Lichenihabitans sp. Uapishka_5]